MSEEFCKPIKEIKLDQTQAVENRYGAAAHAKESCLCSPVSFNPKYLEVIPKKIIDLDYGCGDPTKYVKAGDHVLDLGSGSGKNAFICSQIVGRNGSVVGIDRNERMINLSTQSIPIVAKAIGYSNVHFIRGSIEETEIETSKDNPLIKSGSFDIVISNCVLNLVNMEKRKTLLNNIKRVLKANGRICISDIVSDQEVPLELQRDPDLWSGCISGAWQEDEFIADFVQEGFNNAKYVQRSEEPWKVIQGIQFRSVTLEASL